MKSPPAVDQVGFVVQWASAALLLLVFLQLNRLRISHRLVRTWTVAWAALVFGLAGPVVQAILFVRELPPLDIQLYALLEDLYLPGQLVFLCMVTLAALQAAGKAISPSAVYRTALFAALAGLSFSLAGIPQVGIDVQLIATPLLLFASVQVIFAAANGARRRPLMLLGSATLLLATITSADLLSNRLLGSSGVVATVVHALTILGSYGDAVVLMVLAATVIVLIVQDSFLEAERARVEQMRNLTASETRLDRIIRAAGEAIVTVDPDGRIDLANAAAERLFQLPSGGALGRPLEALLHVSAEPLTGLLSDSREASGYVPGSGIATHVSRGRRPDGSEFPVEFTVGALPAETGRGSVVVLRDLTQRLAAEAQRETNAREMAESKRMATIGQLVSGVAHELNNPLSVVLGQSEQLVMETSGHEDVNSGLRLINEQALRARLIVKDLLALVRSPDDQREAHDLTHLAHRVMTSEENHAAALGVTLTADLPPRLPPVIVDPGKIHQVIVNLLDNAMDATGPGGSVRISARAANGRAEVVIEDSGPGISDENLPRIFEPFFTTKPEGEGSGLGLAVSLGIVKGMRGTIRVENRPAPGIGARFVLSLPIDPDAMELAPVPPPRTATLPPPMRRADGELFELMVIDDEAGVRATVLRIFGRGGWPIRQASTGSEGLAYLLDVPISTAPAIILCDLKMPGMSGMDVYGHLLTRRPDLVSRVIFCTGDVVEPTTAGFLRTSGREVVEKPFTVGEISAVVERVLGLA